MAKPCKVRAGGSVVAVAVAVRAAVAERLVAQRRVTRQAHCKRALQDLLDMLQEWDNNKGNYSGFAGFHAVRQAERILGLPESDVE